MNERIKKFIGANIGQVLLVFLAFLTMVFVSYFYVSRIVFQQMRSIGEETMNTMQATVTGSLIGSELMFANVMQSVETMLKENQSNEEILDYLIATNTYFSENHSAISGFLSVYAYIRDEFLDGSLWVPPEDYYAPSRPWHIGAVKNRDSVYISEPYLDADTGGICITFSQQVFDVYGQSAGIVAIDIDITMITDFINVQTIANDGYGVLLDDQMCFSTHRDIDIIGLNINDVGGEYSILEQMISDGEEISAIRFLNADGVDSIAFFRTIFNGWHIGIIVPHSSYYEQVYVMGAVLSIVGFGLMLVLSYILVRTRAQKIRSDEESMSKSDFLARMSHEMRTPMNAIIGITEIAKNTSEIDKTKNCLVKIENAANHLLGVINDVLDMSKIEAGKFELSVTDFMFSDMLEQVVSVVIINMDKKDQHFTVDVDANIPQAIIADKQRLAQVITNITSNANKFTPEGGSIKLTVRKENETENGCLLRIEVWDNGIGISKEQQLRLFQPFEQADGSTSRKYGGTGLGLAISKKIINLMDGDIWIESELGKGTRFIFTAFVGIGCMEQISATDNQEENFEGLFKGKRIILAEDVEINREIVLALLEPTLLEIDCAINGAEALRMFREAPPGKYNMIFMDLQMPEMDGHEATRQIRASGLPNAQEIPIVAMTANVFREDVEQCIKSGMNAHIGKPLDINEVLNLLKKYLMT
ncbi:MAG: response regulator [Oscillospiraceae bacterium]|jgi:signal transduction histidine kinase/ActR/RegA family two-component response regulator|nr:response regulator [Oscillospiraceae bacterium]